MIIRKTTENDVNLIYEMINELAIYEKRPEDMTGSTKMLKLWLF